MKFATKAVHAGVEPDPSTGAIMTPIFQTSTYVQPSPGKHKGYEYARTQNPTRAALQNSLAAIENGKHGICFASGLASTDAVIKLLKPGDEVISTNDLYGGTYRLLETIFAKYGIMFRYTDMTDAQNVSSLINKNTKLIWAETPTNPMMSIIDLQTVSKIAKDHKILFTVDNTFASPYLQNPLDLGADIVMHSITKYLGGHSDVVMGALVVKDDDLHDRLATLQNSTGAVPGPQDCFLVLRGIKTLHVRMERHCENAKEVAEYLRDNSNVENVYWPGFEDHKNHEIAARQMKDFGAMISFSLHSHDQERAFRVLEKFKVFSLAESLGGVESLCGHPASMTHASIPVEERKKLGLKDSLIRLSIGIEDVEDLITDLEQALD